MSRKRQWEQQLGNRSLHGADVEVAKIMADQFDIGKKTEVDGNVLNVRPDPLDFRDRFYEAGLVWVEPSLVPLAADLADVPVRSQGAEGSCTGQALAAVIDLQNVHRYNKGADVPQAVSARMLYEQARAFDEFTEDGLPGSSARGAIKGFYHRGVCGAVLAPYFDGDTSFKLTVERAKDARRVTLGSYFRLRHILNDYHSAINEAGAIYCTAMIHAGWQTARLNEGHIKFRQDPRPPLIGGHAFAIIGYTKHGFIILNSWGPDWGGVDAAKIVDKPRKPSPEVDRTDRLPGTALWSYDDWRANVLDAWVLRLQAPTNKATGFRGGYYQKTTVKQESGQNISTTTPASEIAGHYIHVRNGELVDEPPYDSTFASVDETANFLRQDGERSDKECSYDHLMFYAHGGLNNLEDAVVRAGAMTEGFKRNRIYPIFYIWRTGIGDSATEVMKSVRDRILGRAGGVLDNLSDALVERVAADLGKMLWEDMKKNAALCAAKDQGGRPSGAGWEASRRLIEAARKRKNPLKVHFVGHSAGAIFLGDLFARASAEKFALDAATISLFAPACTTDFFSRKLAPLATGMASPGSFGFYHLSDSAERDDNVANVYRKSLLYLVSNAFETRTPEQIVGMEKYLDDYIKTAKPPASFARYVAPNDKHSRSTSHGGFDNDATTMNHVLARILGVRPSALDGKGFTDAELDFG